ncbi:MAG TPA: hypothetical protein ENJ99_02480, partial [Rhizobiales bacterium]|nr:hypothetical protein [Hyphomicrobiales bacterium]
LHPAVARLSEDDWRDIDRFAGLLRDHLQPLEQSARQGHGGPLAGLIDLHVAVAEAICTRTPSGECALWQGEAGAALAGLVSQMKEAASQCPDLTLFDYAGLFASLAGAIAVRPRHLGHQPLAIYGLLEARMAEADVMILAGLNETVWPGVARTDPWLTRPQTAKAGLPAPERAIGLSAHDFVQGFCLNEAFICYSNKISGSPAVPSRWILRLKALLAAAGKQELLEDTRHGCWRDWARLLDQPEAGDFSPVSPPCPAPPVALRRRAYLSVSAADTLMDDPYAFYARYILRLAELDGLERSYGPLERGLVVHAALCRFMKEHKGKIPAGSGGELFDMMCSELDKVVDDPAISAQWRPRFARMAEWFVSHERGRDIAASNVVLENTGHTGIEAGELSCQLTARADRIDLLAGTGVRIIDYKTGQMPSFTSTAQNFSAQLLLEAAIVLDGGFKDVPAGPVKALEYMGLSGGVPAGKVASCKGNIEEKAREAFAGLAELLIAYGDSQRGYRARVWPESGRFPKPYEYLSRWREWAYLLDNDGAGDDE